MKCPRCHRDTYSAKWKQCTACQYEQDVTNSVPVTNRVTNTIAPRVPAVPRARLTAGRHPSENPSPEALRKRAERARKKAGANA